MVLGYINNDVLLYGVDFSSLLICKSDTTVMWTPKTAEILLSFPYTAVNKVMPAVLYFI